MKHLERVVWSEGMALGPHHFQSQALYFEHSLHFAASALWFAGYGFVGLELDQEALKNGTVSLIHGRGIFPDGLPFHMPDSDAPPEARNIADLFPPLRDRLMVYLAVPAHKADGLNCSLEEEGSSQPVRYVAESKQLHDDNTGRDEKPVRLGRKNVRFCLETELAEGLVTLPAARIIRTGAGHFEYDTDFIPPCLQIAASPQLMMLLNRLMEILGEKSSAFQRVSTQGGVAAGFSQLEVSSFWFLHCVNSCLAAMRNLCIAKKGHPEEVFVELSRLAGGLCTFGLDSHPAALPLYNHDDLEYCFHGIERSIRMHLDAIIPTNCVSVPLESEGNYLHNGKILDDRCLGRSQWIFSINAKMGEADLIRLAPQLIKVCSKEFVPKLVQRALPGMTMTHLQAPPAAVAPLIGHQYYLLSRSGPCWEHIMKSREVGAYVPGEFPDARIGLHVILES